MPTTAAAELSCSFVGDVERAAVPAEARRRRSRSCRGRRRRWSSGPAGDEIYTDKYGRVKVQFHWDRDGKKDENSSCWIRVSQPWAGKGWGAVSTPRIGQEVIVDFLEGDPDQPIITGRVYNAEQMPPYELPANKTQTGIKSAAARWAAARRTSTRSGSRTRRGRSRSSSMRRRTRTSTSRTTRRTGSGTIATKTIDHDETTHVKHDRTETVDNNETITIHGARTETVDKNETITITGHRTETVNGGEDVTINGARSHTVNGVQTTTISLAEAHTVGAARAHTVGAARGDHRGRRAGHKCGRCPDGECRWASECQRGSSAVDDPGRALLGRSRSALRRRPRSPPTLDERGC